MICAMDAPGFGSTSVEEFNNRRENVNSVNTQKTNRRAANTFGKCFQVGGK